MATDLPQAQTIAAIERASDVLSLFAESDEATLGITEIGHTLGLSKAVVYRILSSFRVKGYVEVDPASRRYSLGPRALQLGLAYLNRIDVRTLARPELEGLSAATHETATLSVRSGWQRVYIDQVTPERDVKMVVQLGRSVPLHAGASSKAFLAFLSGSELDALLKENALTSLTPKTVTSEKALRKELAAIHDRGYAVSLGERMNGAASVAAPVLGHDGQAVAVMSVSGPLERFEGEVDDAVPLLVAATSRVSSLMGYIPG